MTLEPRLAAHMQVGAFLRLTQEQGDFATILRKGDATSGSILLVGRIRGSKPMIYERFPSLDGPATWEKLLRQDAPSEQDISDYLQKRGERDPDLWIIELDTADDERLAGLLDTKG